MEATTTILVVDDDECIRRLLSESFSSPEYLVLTAPDGETALELASKNRVRLAYVDLRLPRIRGDEVCRRLREVEPGIKLVLMSGFFDDEVGFLLESSADVLMGKLITATGAQETAEFLLSQSPAH